MRCTSRKGWPELAVAGDGVRWALVSSSQLPVEVVETDEAEEVERSERLLDR